MNGDDDSALNAWRRELRLRIEGWHRKGELTHSETIAVWAVLELDMTLQTVADELHDIVRNTQDTRI